MMKLFRKLHLWLSIPFGLIFALTCLTGALLVYEQPLTELANPGRYKVSVPADAKPMPLSELLPLVQASLPDSVQVAGVTISPEADRAYQVSLSQPRRATVGVNQYTGEVLGSTSRTPFFSTVFSLHRWIGGSRDSIGKTVVGVSTLLMVIVVLTGLLIWIPKSLPSLRNRLSIKLNKGWRRFWFDLHVSGGFYATLLLLVFALTGLTWSFPWYRSAFYGMLGVEMKAPQHGAKPGAHGPQGQGRPEGQGRGEGRGREGQGRPEGRDGEGQGRGEGRGFEGQGRGEGRPQPNQYISWQRALDAVIAESGNEQKFTVQDGNISAALGGWGNIRAADTYSFDRRGQITGVERYADKDYSSKAGEWIFTLHTGRWGGWFSNLLSFIVCLMGGILPITGYYLWIKRSFGKRR
jgi:uncharacterized iron-regulated membrane protein